MLLFLTVTILHRFIWNVRPFVCTRVHIQSRVYNMTWRTIPFAGLHPSNKEILPRPDKRFQPLAANGDDAKLAFQLVLDQVRLSFGPERRSQQHTIHSHYCSLGMRWIYTAWFLESKS